MRGHYKHKENTEEIAANVKNSAYEIINRKHATYYGIAMSVRRICEVIMRDEKSILPVSHMMHGQYGIDGVVLSMPAIVGANGVESDIPIELNGEEALKLKESADALKSILDGLEPSLSLFPDILPHKVFQTAYRAIFCLLPQLLSLLTYYLNSLID